MGTSNFAHNVNTSCIYVIEDSYYDTKTKETILDDFIWDNTIADISNKIENSIKDNKELIWFEDNNIDVDDRYNRNYPATSIGELIYDGKFKDIFYRIILIPKAIAGYYMGFSLDYDIRIEIEDVVYDSIENAIQDIKEYPEELDIPENELDKYIPDLQYDIEDNLTFMSSIIENVFKQVSTPVHIAASFDNGETLYMKCKG